MRRVIINLLPLLIVVVATVLTYRNLPQTFFQQDEWQYFGSSIYALLSPNPIANVALPLQGQVTHFFPLASIFYLLEYVFFKTNFAPYVIINLILHITNATLVYFLIFLMTQKRMFAWGSAALFAVNSLAHQPITWVAAGIGTLLGTVFLLLFLLSFLKFLESKQSQIFVASVLSLIIAILFKETSLLVFLFFPFVWFTFHYIFKRSIKLPKKVPLIFISVGFFYLLLRIFFLVSSARSAQPEIGDVSAVSPMTYFYRVVTVPLKALPQSIVPFGYLRASADTLVRLAYPRFVASDGVTNPYVTESIAFDLVCYLASALLFFLSYKVYRSLCKRSRTLADTFVLSILFIMTAAMPFIFIPGRAGYFSIFEPRNLYVMSIGTSVFVTLLIYVLTSKMSQTNATLTAVILISVLVALHSFAIQTDIAKLQEFGMIRKQLLTTVEESYPKLPSSVIVYTQSDRSYYGLPEEEKILPIQSGFGRMIMVWYQDTEKFPGCLYENQFLHDLVSEGYRFCEGRGFGYVRSYPALLKLMKVHHLTINSIIAFSWNSKEEEFTKITLHIQESVTRNLGRAL